VAQFPKDGPLPTTPNITSISQSEASASIALKRSVDENERGFYTLRDDSRRALLGPPKVFSVLNTNLATVNDLLSTYATNGPLVPRLVMAGMLTSPTVTISLQRDFVDVGGNVGELSLGELPNGIKNTSLTVSFIILDLWTLLTPAAVGTNTWIHGGPRWNSRPL
jgi:hypothetical protein